ncbi:beta-phosphoglucomutase [Anaerobium acetethylicum]|uniref:Beta-phosphoglucomutase n=2 Tax=Anaerobium acetethylicum TaxID=1619234 RepID=A0A1D3TT02_9FIRM|nr:beta-phosphoglucomutase [Anaerobium acetethylicum]SCP97008.1 beta-phosphoglucomutase [Anaerobium acetethylicum]
MHIYHNSIINDTGARGILPPDTCGKDYVTGHRVNSNRVISGMSKLENIKGVIFDLDGVICFTDQYHFLAWKEIADKEGIEFNEAINERLRGVSRAESLEIILEKATREYSAEEKTALMEQKNNIYKEHLKDMLPTDLSKEVKDTLDELRARGLKLAIGSSSKNTEFILERIGLDGFFDKISDGKNIINSKPDPEVFLKAADMIELKPEECLVIEDAEAGIHAAVSGGFHNAGIGSASKYAKTENAIASFRDILELV